MEFKASENRELLLERAQEELEQIKKRKYMEGFRQQGVGSVLVIGLAFFGKMVELVYEDVVV